MIRTMIASDIGDVLKIEQECFSDPWSESGFYAELALDVSHFIVYSENEKIIGFACMQCICDEGYVINFAVLPQFRNKGIGSNLLEALISFSKARNLSFMTLEVRKSNLSAIRLYMSKGFSIVGIRPNFYSKPNEDALLMTLLF